MDPDSFFKSARRIPRDPIFALTEKYNHDESPLKVNLGQGAYRDENGSPWTLPSVAEARRRLASGKLDHEYLPILGLTEFRMAACKLALGLKTFAATRHRISSTQSLSGTGGLHSAAALIKSCSSLNSQVWIPEPTWSNHHLVFSSLGFDCRSFRYYDLQTRSVDMRSYMTMLRSVRPNSIIILHACAHNPTGCDPTRDQWKEIGHVMKERQLFPLFDAAYLGFCSGRIEEDAFAIRYFVDDLGMEIAVAMSFAKNMGLYGERVGCTFVVTKSKDIAKNCESMLERLQRSEVSNPPAYGAKIASHILNDSNLREMWYDDLVTMSSRIKSMRGGLYNLLIKNDAPGNWQHIVNQSGMFGFLGLSHELVIKLRERYHIYMAENSRISIAGLNESNLGYVAQAIAECMKALQEPAGRAQKTYLLKA